jgi:glycerol-3-phosphate acyltransferase PlsY
LLTVTNILSLIFAYLLGSIPSAVWIGQALYGIDVREYGSGNAGATNTFRVLGKKAGIPVLFLDVFKGWAAVNIPYLLVDYKPGSEQFIGFQLALAITALIGHIFPVYVGFRGGKGVATTLGIIIAVNPLAALICIGIFIISLTITKFVSLSSMITGMAYPMIIMLVFKNNSPSLNIFSLAVTTLVLVTHQKNIERLIKGEESRVKFKK